MDKAQLQRHIDRARLRVLFNTPFFAPGVARLNVVWDESIPTACTDGKQIIWNPKFFAEYQKLDADLQVSILCEEVCHCLLGHLWRAPDGADWATWNMACDQEVRWMMKGFGEVEKAKGKADPFPFQPEFEPDSQYRGLSAEEVYHRLINKPKGKGGKQGQGNAPLGQFSKPPQAGQGSQQQARKMKTEWDHALMQSVEMTRQKGNLPADLKRYVKTLVSPTVPWWELLRNFLREQCADDWNFMKPSPFYEDSGFMMPSLESEKMGDVVFATDTSGSIDDKVLARFNSEKQSCLDDLSPAKLVDICCDARIQQVREYRPGDTIENQAPGGGGSDSRPVYQWIEDQGMRPKCVVYLTDLYLNFPQEEPNCPVLWVTWTPDMKAPFGLTVFAE